MKVSSVSGNFSRNEEMRRGKPEMFRLVFHGQKLYVSLSNNAELLLFNIIRTTEVIRIFEVKASSTCRFFILQILIANMFLCEKLVTANVMHYF